VSPTCPGATSGSTCSACSQPPGGDRWRWESRIFAGAYDDRPPASRPKYGALNFRKRRIGGSPRFGSAHFRLTAEALIRTTFCYPDSFSEPSHFGTAARISALVKLAEADDKDLLDDHIEAHVHGTIDIVGDVEALVLDPCYRATPVEDAASRLGCPVEWHGGFTITTADLLQNPQYRGPEFVRLGASLTRDGLLTVAEREGAGWARVRGSPGRAALLMRWINPPGRLRAGSASPRQDRSTSFALGPYLHANRAGKSWHSGREGPGRRATKALSHLHRGRWSRSRKFSGCRRWLAEAVISGQATVGAVRAGRVGRVGTGGGRNGGIGRCHRSG
jgi:Protein of unknown function (DUF3626)